MDDTSNATAITKFTLPHQASYSFLLPAQQQAPSIHKGGQNQPKRKKTAAIGNCLRSINILLLCVCTGIGISIV